MHSASTNATEWREASLAPVAEVVAGVSLTGREYVYFAYAYFYFTHDSLRARQVSVGQ